MAKQKQKECNGHTLIKKQKKISLGHKFKDIIIIITINPIPNWQADRKLKFG